MIIKLYFCNTIIETATNNKLKIKIMTTLTTLTEIKKIKTFSTREKFEIKGNVIFFDVDNWTWRAKNIFGFGFASPDDLKKLLKYVLENK
jgi:hypothetical protein